MNYKTKVKHDSAKKIDILLADMPYFVRTYVNAREGAVSSSTLLNYVRHISAFFAYLTYERASDFKDVQKMTVFDLSQFTVHDFEDFVHAVRNGYFSDGKILSEKSVNGYISALSSLYAYFVRIQEIPVNVPALLERRKVKKARHVVHLDVQDSRRFIDSVNGGWGLSDVQRRYFMNLSARDTAICAVLLRTGIRVSELVGLNLSDVDFKECSISVIRKRDKPDIVYFDGYTEACLKVYLKERASYKPAKDEQALFLVSLGKYKGQRLSVRSVENLVKKYAMAAGVSEAAKITPHRLRATFAHDMLAATGGDLNLVQQALDHERPETTVVYLDERRDVLKKNRNLLSSYINGQTE